MTPIESALEQGHSEEDILSYLKKAFPKIVPKILKAQNTGYSVSNILNFLSTSMKGNGFDGS